MFCCSVFLQFPLFLIPACVTESVVADCKTEAFNIRM